MTSSCFRPRRDRFQILVFLVCAVGLGCGAPSSDLPRDLSLLSGLIYADEPVIVAPGRRWDVAEGNQGWTFRGQGSLWWYVRETPESPVTVTLRPAAESAGFWFLLHWDGVPLFEDPVSVDADGLEIEIPTDKLTPGDHDLRLIRRRGPRWESGPSAIENVFAEIGFRSAGTDHRLAPEEVDRFRQLGSFVELGATGHDQERRSGFLFLEPRTVEMEIYRDQPATLRVTGENLGEGRARFAISAPDSGSEHVFDAQGRHHFQVPLTKGRNRLRFQVATENGAAGPFLWGAPVVVAAAESRPLERRPPVILLSLDTTRRDALSPYGAPAEITPELDAFARQATVFDQAHATAPWTLPSHASMFTGLYPSRHGAGVAYDKLDGGLPSLAGMLRDHGYYTAGVSGGPLTAHRFGLGQSFHQYRDQDPRGTRGDRMTDYALEVLDAWGDRPFFLFLNYFDAHGPYEPPEEAKAAAGVEGARDQLADPDAWQATIEGKAGKWQKLTAGLDPIPEEVLAYVRSVYLAEVAFQDSQIGRLFERLKRDGIFDRALIVVTADHGQLLGEHGFHGHSHRLDAELIDAPLIVKWPRQREGTRVSDLASIVDVFPTILEAAGVPAPPSDGHALGPSGIPGGGSRELVIMEEHESIVHPLRGPMRLAPHLVGFQSADFRHVWWPEGESCSRVVDGAWVDDDCPRDSERRAAIEQMLASPAEEIAPGAEPLSEEDRKRLEALGYL